MEDELVEVTKSLGASYKAWKDGEKDKNEAKKEFFKAVDKLLSQETAAVINVAVSARSHKEAERRAVERHPEYTVITVSGPPLGSDSDQYSVAMQEDPTLRPYTFVNPEDGKVYSRQVVSGAPMLDDERLREEDPELWEAITHIPQDRVLKPLDELSDEQLGKLSEFMYSSKPTVKLGAPRKAKAEELEVE